MNEKYHNNIFGIIVFIASIAIICIGVIYYYRGADRQLESELDGIERINSELASETRDLQAGLVSHGKGLASVTVEIGKSRERIKHVYTEIDRSSKETERAVGIIEQCEDIIEKIKTQR